MLQDYSAESFYEVECFPSVPSPTYVLYVLDTSNNLLQKAYGDMTQPDLIEFVCEQVADVPRYVLNGSVMQILLTETFKTNFPNATRVELRIMVEKVE